LTIIIGQVPKLLGVEKTEGDFFRQLWGVLGKLGDTSGLTLLVGTASLVLVLELKRFAPVVPGSLAAVLLGIAAVHVFKLDDHGVSIVGPIPTERPSFGFPDIPTHRSGVSCRLERRYVMDVIVERCAGLDVHRDSVVATVRVPGKGKSRSSLDPTCAFRAAGRHSRRCFARCVW
jgi:hypothetical protein